jgi:hypothetical protein
VNENGGSISVKELVSRGLYAFVGLTLSGVLTFSVYVVRDLKEDVQHCEGQVLGLTVQMKTVNDQVIVNAEKVQRLEQDMIKVRGVKWMSPRGEWDER